MYALDGMSPALSGGPGPLRGLGGLAAKARPKGCRGVHGVEGNRRPLTTVRQAGTLPLLRKERGSHQSKGVLSFASVGPPYLKTLPRGTGVGTRQAASVPMPGPRQPPSLVALPSLWLVPLRLVGIHVAGQTRQEAAR